MHDLAALLQHGHLILTGRHSGGTECRDIRCLADGVGEEAHRDAGLEVPHLDLALHGGVALQAAHRDQIHIIEAQLCQLRHHGLDEDVDLVGVQTAGQIVQCHLQDVLADLLRVIGVVRQGLRVSDHNIDLVELAGVLQAHALLQRANVVANMQAARGTVAGQNDLFHGNDSPSPSGGSPSQSLLRNASSPKGGALGRAFPSSGALPLGELARTRLRG